MHHLPRHAVALLLLLGLGTGLTTAPALAAPAYTIADLGLLRETDDTAIALGINDAGEVVGYSGSLTTEQAFRWHQGGLTNLGTLSDGETSIADDINEDGQVVGGARRENVDENTRTFHAVTWLGGTIAPLSELPGTQGSFAHAINDAGVIVGENGRAVLWDQEEIIPLPAGPSSVATDINDRNQVVGYDRETDSTTTAFLWEAAMGDGRLILGDLPGGRTSSIAAAINDLGQVVGTSEGTDGPRAFLWFDGMMIDLGVLPGNDGSSAVDINDKGQVVGYNSRTGSGATSSFLWDNGQLLDLGSLVHNLDGWRLTFPSAINNIGQIVGSGIIGGEVHAFLLTPVPEPNVGLVFGLGVISLLGVRRVSLFRGRFPGQGRRSRACREQRQHSEDRRPIIYG